MTTNSSRRDFLKQAALLIAGVGGSIAFDANYGLMAEAKSGYKIGPWTGDDFTVGHKLRDGKIPKFPTTATEKADFVIVGGGIAGLSSAHFLRDSNFLLLEQYEDLGGHARGSSYQGIGYSYGSAYLATVEGAMGELLDDLDLTPIKLDDSKFAWLDNGSWLRGCEGVSENIIYKEFKRFRSENQSFWNKWNGLYPQITELPELLKLDDVLMEETLKNYDPRFVALLDGFIKSGLNGGIKSVSALSGLSTMEDIFVQTYVLPGGNPAITSELSKRLKESHGERVKTGSFVWDIRLKDDGASVTYGMRDGSFHMVDCRHVILAIPQMVAARVARNLPDKAKAAMFRFRYGSYAVANVLMKKKVLEGSYDNYLPAPYEIGDVTIAETPYLLNGTYKPEMGSVLSIYVPYDAGSTGRTLLYQGNKKKLASSIMAELIKAIPPIKDNVEEIVLSRWGHALAVARPQYFKYVGELMSYETNSLSFAHSSAHGLPGAEAAVQGALHASQKAKAIKVSAKPIYSISKLSKTTTTLVQLIAILSLILSAMAPAYAAKGTVSGAQPKRAATSPKKAPPAKQPLIYRASNNQQNMDAIAAVGVSAYGNIKGINVKGTYLTFVHETGIARNLGMVSGDLLLMINNKVTESPEQTLGLISEFSGVNTTLKFARKEGDVLVIHESPSYWVIRSAESTASLSSPGSDDVATIGAVTRAPQHKATAEELEDFMMQLVNNARTLNGDLPKLKMSQALSDMARAYAQDMAKRNFFSHKNPEGLGMVERANAAGITQHISENLGTTRSIVELREQVKQCQQIMMNEPPNVPGNHRSNILDPENKTFGIGVGFPAKGGVITVQEFSHEDLP